MRGPLSGHRRRRSCSLKEGDCLPLDVPQAELAGAGDSLAEEFPGPLNITELAAGEEHPGTQRRPLVIEGVRDAGCVR